MSSRRVPVTVAAVVFVIIAAIGGLALTAHLLAPAPRPPAVLEPSQAFLMPNGTLYLGVYNSWGHPVNVTSVQVAEIQGFEPSDVYAQVDGDDGALRVLCCLDGGQARTVAQSAEWAGGGKVAPGGVALLKFQAPPAVESSLSGPAFLAIGSPWFPMVNLNAFTTTVEVNGTLPDVVPVHAVVYPNDSMDLGVVRTSGAAPGAHARVSFLPLFIRNPLNASYAVAPLGGGWYRLSGGSDLPPYFEMTDEPITPVGGRSYNPATSFIVSGLTPAPLMFADDMVTQVPPIVAPTYQFAGGSSSSDGTSTYGVAWEITMNASSTYRVPLTLYAGQYWFNASYGAQASLGVVHLSSPSRFNSSYFSGYLVVTVPAPRPGATLLVTLGYGQYFEAGVGSTSGNTVTANVTMKSS